MSKNILLDSKKLEFLKQNNININLDNNDFQDLINIITNLELIQKINWEFLDKLKENKNNEYLVYREFLHSLFKKNNPILQKNNKLNVEDKMNKRCKKFNVEVEFNYESQGQNRTVNDFTLYFNQRLNYFNRILYEKIDNENLTRISALNELEKNSKVSIIGLIYEMNYTKNGHLIITLEDKSGQIKCFINKNKLNKTIKSNDNFIKLINNLCLDEGIGINGKMGDDIIWVDDVIIPEIEDNKNDSVINTNDKIICLSDIHIGSCEFDLSGFLKFLKFIQTKTKSDKLNKIANEIKHIIIAGDLIEGVGVYPGQDKDLIFYSAEIQYNFITFLLSQIPNNKCIITISGNHDANRLSLPQPQINFDYGYSIYNLSNLIMLSNPSRIILFEHLSFFLYHGDSLIYYADTIEELRSKGGIRNVENVVQYLLDKGHLAPSHGSVLYVPETSYDPLTIPYTPNFFITGHTHKLSVSQYKNCNIISCGCWLEENDYQRNIGLIPDISKAVLINPKTKKSSILNFR